MRFSSPDFHYWNHSEKKGHIFGRVLQKRGVIVTPLDVTVANFSSTLEALPLHLDGPKGGTSAPWVGGLCSHQEETASLLAGAVWKSGIDPRINGAGDEPPE